MAYNVQHDNSLSTVVSVDGKTALITPFGLLTVPPPMSATQLTVPANIVHVAFVPGCTDFALLTNDATLHLCTYTPTKAQPSASATVQYSAPLPPKASHVTFLSATTCVACLPDGHADKLVYIQLQANEAWILDEHPLGGKIGGVRVYASTVWLQATNGHIYHCTASGDKFNAVKKYSQGFPEYCPQFDVTKFHSDDADVTLVGLSKRSKLYANGQLVASNCASYFIHPHFLLFTTSQQQLELLDRTKCLEEHIQDPTARSTRLMERGANIVTAYGMHVLLQMPRGNLEAISPRSMVVHAVFDLLNSFQWKQALLTCRRNRVDMNILFDYNPEQFLDHVDDFIQQVADPDYLNQFLSELRAENVITAKYDSSSKYNQTLYPLSFPSDTRVGTTRSTACAMPCAHDWNNWTFPNTSTPCSCPTSAAHHPTGKARASCC
jgi:elongator complex protein 1